MSHRRSHLTVLGLYTGLALLLTWPLVAQITTHVPGIAQWAFDESTFIWNIWYFKHALVDHLRNPLHSELIWYPLGIDLVLYTYNFYHVLAAQPLALAVNLAFGSNVTLLCSTLLSGYGTFLLVRYLLQRNERAADGDQQPPHPEHRIAKLLPAVIAGLLYAFASNRSIYAALGHYDMVTTQWIPFYALMLLRSLDHTLPAPGRRKAALLAGLFFAFTGLAEMISALFLAIFTLIVSVVFLTVGRRRDPVGAANTPPHSSFAATLGLLSPALGLISLIAFALWSPVLIPILHQFLTNDFSLKGWGEAIPLSTDLLGWFTPTQLHPFFGGELVPELRRVQELAHQPDGVGFRDLNTVFLGWVSLLLAVMAALGYGRQLAIWLWTSLIFGFFTLGPFLQINGRYQFDLDGIPATFPLPYALLHYLPIIKANRAPNRNSVLLLLGLAVLVGYGCYWLLRMRADRPRRPARQFMVGTILAAAILFEHLALPLPLSDAHIPAVYAEIAADPRPVSVLQFPLGWRNSFRTFGPEQTQLQYFQSAHGKPMIGGNISRAPDFKLAYFERLPFFQVLEKVQRNQAVDPDLLAMARAQTQALLYLYNVGYVLLYPPIPERRPYDTSWQATWAFVKENLPLEPQPFWAEAGIEAYRVIQPAGADHFTLDLGVLGTFAYRGEGWAEGEAEQGDGITFTWATAQRSRLFVPLRQVQADAIYQVRLRLRPYLYPGSAAQTVQLTVNQAAFATQTLSDDWQEINWAIPGSLLVDGLNRLELDWGYALAPRQVTPGSRTIGATGITLPIDVDLKGFNEGGFIALFDEAGQQIDAAAGRKGVNVTVLDQASGAVLHKVGFDTTANVYESERLAQFLHDLEPGALTLVVSNGDAAAFLTPAAVAGLRGLGAEVTLEQLRGQYFAVAGVQGAAPGSAVQVLHEQDAFLRISLERDRRTLAAAVDWVEVVRSEQ